MSVISWVEANFETKKIGGNLQINCPFCGDTQFHFGVHPKKRVANCFRASCGWKGSALDLVMQYEDCNFREAVKILGDSDSKKFSRDEYESAVERFRNKSTRSEGVRMPEGYRPLDDSSKVGKACLRYLMDERGLSTRQIADIGAGICDMEKYAGYVVLPVFENKVPVYFVARRVIDLGGPKYTFPSAKEIEIGKSNWLYNWDKARRYKRVYVAEGVFDAIAVGDMAVCTFGTKLSEIQLQKMIRAGHNRATIILDEDALEDAYDMAEILRPHMKVDVIHMEGGDPADLEGDFVGLEKEKINQFSSMRRRLDKTKF